MSEENKKKLKEYQKSYRESKKNALPMQILFVVLLFFKGQNGVLIIIKDFNVWLLALQKTIMILLKHHFIL